MRILRGIPASPGTALARVHHVTRDLPVVVRAALPASDLDREVARLHAALADARAQIQALVARLSADLGPEGAAILESHLLILEDELVVDRAVAIVRAQSCNAEAAFHDAVAEVASRLLESQDDYLRERVQDLRDVEDRVLRVLMGLGVGRLVGPAAPSVVAADDLAPSDTAAIGARNVLAFALGRGSRTSHVAILARSLGIPAVAGLGAAVAELHDGELVAVDGDRGEVVLQPDSETVARYRQLSQQQLTVNAKLAHLKDEPAITPDGRRLHLLANIEMPVEVEKALASGAEGIGLLRTEYIYFQRQTIPTEAQQLEIYAGIMRGMEGRPVVFRTLDVGGDKVQRYLGARKESNPFLGWRGIRFLLANRPLLKAQLRAIYRAAAGGPARLMFPMITGVEELREAREACRECVAELAAEGLPHDPDLQVGIMIETPAAALVADLLAAECDFFSFGTNDLVQYTLAMDRLNSRVAYLYQPVHPAVLRLLRDATAAAHAAGIRVGICGEMASETRYAEILLGLGLDEVSVHAAQLPKIKQVVRWTTVAEAEGLLADLMSRRTAAEADLLLADYLAEKKRRRAAAETPEVPDGA
ncbi:MAG: phosphoenolpyruvate--protein phosphotransferase [Gemmatimonas sp.]|nr:phosphoenolpyruvate--protein phosphotransferase [Gemmatimonas sp.]